MKLDSIWWENGGLRPVETSFRIVKCEKRKRVYRVEGLVWYVQQIDCGTQQQSGNIFFSTFGNCTAVCPGEGSMRSCPARKCLPQRNFECSQTDGGRHSGPCLVRGVQRDTVPGVWAVHESYGCCETQIPTRKLQQLPSLLKTKSRRTILHAAC